MIAVKDPRYNDALYGRTGTDALCQGCARPADYLARDTESDPWSSTQGWCLTCRPRRGRPPHHGERTIRAWISTHTCSTCQAPATHAITAATDPALSVLRRGKAVSELSDILTRANAYCDEHVPIQTLGAKAAAAAHPYADAARLRTALEDPAAASYGAIAKLLGVRDGGTTTRSLLRNHAAHLAADPTFPPLPAPRTQSEWGALAWAQRHAERAATAR